MNALYERLPGESEYEYGLRLIETKIEQHPDDLDWQDIIDLTGMDCHRDTLRKAASTTEYSGYKVAQYFKSRPAAEANPSRYMEELNNKLLEIRKESKQLWDQRRERNKLIDSLSRTEHLEDVLVDVAERMNEEMPLLNILNVDHWGHEYTEAIVCLSDWHYGMVADNIWEHYDTEECRRRVSVLVDKVRNRLIRHDCRKLHVLMLGDMAHGAIHVSARVAAEETACEQLMHVSEMLAEAISQMAEVVDETMIYCTYGNHMRTVQNKKESIHADNMERLIPWWLKQRFKMRDDVKIVDSEYYEFLRASVCGYEICATHGDLDSVRGAGQMLNTLFNKKYGEQIDYVLLGDKHHRESFEELGIDATIVRSLCGSDEYANGKRKYSTPGQLMLVFNDKGVDAEYNIKFN